MTTDKIGTIDVQYVACYYTSKMKVLFGDRRKDMTPIMSVYNDNVNQIVTLEVENLVVEDQIKKTVKEGMDLYLLKNELKNFLSQLEALFELIRKKVVLDRAARNSKDPRPTYDGKGLPIPIIESYGFVKINSICADFKDELYSISVNRTKVKNVDPSLKFDTESWKTNRFHIGIHDSWTEKSQDDLVNNKIKIDIPWKEFGQLIDSIREADKKL